MGCGGTVSRYAEEGKRVIVVIFANGNQQT
ncbi:hypothetical protein J4476_04290 [Candidatus Woesearchaeota archaeon]|nr:hypothetical protein [Candidatus Woesearchaeota archaeon]